MIHAYSLFDEEMGIWLVTMTLGSVYLIGHCNYIVILLFSRNLHYLTDHDDE